MFHTNSSVHWIWKIKLMQMIYIITIILSNTWIILEIMHRSTKLSLFHKFHLNTQLVLSLHLPIGNMMYHINSSNHLTGRTWLIRMITLIITTLISTSIILEITLRRTKLYLRSTLLIQLVLNHLPKTGNTMFHTKWRSHSSKKIEMDSMTWEMFTILINISIHLVNMPKLVIKL